MITDLSVRLTYAVQLSFCFFFGRISSCSRLCPKRQMGWAQFDRRGHVAGGLGAIRGMCRAWRAIYTFLTLGTHNANPRVSAISPGAGFWHRLSPCTHEIVGCKPRLSARRGYTQAHFLIFAQSTALRSCRPSSVQPPSSSSVQLSARVPPVVVADCFDQSLCYPPYATTSRCGCSRCCFCQVSIDMPRQTVMIA